MKLFLKNTVKKVKKIPDVLLPQNWRLKKQISNIILFYLLALLAVLFSGCTRPTYPANQLIKSIKELCKNEYDLDVDVRAVATTVGLSIQIEGLVNEEMRLDEEASKTIERLALSMRRITLSTDRPIDFYIICARDTKMIGAEYVLTCCAIDVKRAMLWDISRSDYLSRIQKDFRINPQILGEDKVKNLFKDLSSKIKPEETLAKYTYFEVNAETFQELFAPISLLAQPQSINYEIINIQAKKITNSEALLWVKVRETYQPKPSAKIGVTVFPPGYVNEYLIWINRAFYNTKPIMAIIPKYFVGQENIITQRNMPGIFARYPDLRILDRQGLPIKEINLMDFLAEQMARRLKMKLEHEQPFKECFQVISTTGSFEDRIFKLNFNIEGEEKQILEQAVTVAAVVTYGYKVKDFAGLEIISQTSKTKINLTPEQLEQFRLKRLSIEQLLTKTNYNAPLLN